MQTIRIRVWGAVAALVCFMMAVLVPACSSMDTRTTELALREEGSGRPVRNAAIVVRSMHVGNPATNEKALPFPAKSVLFEGKTGPDGTVVLNLPESHPFQLEVLQSFEPRRSRLFGVEDDPIPGDTGATQWFLLQAMDDGPRSRDIEVQFRRPGV